MVRNEREWTWRCFFITLSLTLGQLAFGYPSSVIATTLGQPSFLIYMGLVTTTGELASNASQLIGAMNGVYQAGACFGLVLNAWIMDKWGRKVAVICPAILSLIGGACVTAAQNPAMFIAFRFLAGAGAWPFLALIPIYTTEIAPPRLRGFFVGLNGMFVGLGNALASYMGLAFYHIDNPVTQWRGPLGLALIFPAFMLLLMPFVPESPRWLLLKGRVDEARKICLDLHSPPGDSYAQFAQSEFYQMKKQAEHDESQKTSWIEILQRPSYRKRAVVTALYAFFGQTTALLVINNYGPTLYGALGYGALQQLELQCAWISLAIPANFLGACVMDRIGRKPLLILGIAGSCVCLIIFTIISATCASPIPPVPNIPALRMGVAALFLLVWLYGMGVDVAGIVFFSEIWPNHMRSKGVTIAFCTISISSLVFLEVMPTAFAAIGWKYFLVFITLSAVGTGWTWLFIPETKNLPLEEIGVLFGDKDEVAVFSNDIFVDQNTHEVMIQDHEHPEIRRVATNADSDGLEEKGSVAHVNDGSTVHIGP